MNTSNKLVAFDKSSDVGNEIHKEEEKKSVNSFMTNNTITRKRFRIPKYCSRVIFNTDNLNNIKVHVLPTDLLLVNAMRSTTTRGKQNSIGANLLSRHLC